MARPLKRRPPPLEPEEIQARVLYRDGLILVIDKPAGLAVHAGPSGAPNLEECFDALRYGLPRPPALAHRLDADTSGVLVLGRHPKALSKLGRLFSGRDTEKTYWAVVEGTPPADEGVFDWPLLKVNTKSGWSVKISDKGQTAVSRYRVLGRAPGMTWLELTPETGRTHQLRVHCAHAGCPIIGATLHADAGSSSSFHVTSSVPTSSSSGSDAGVFDGGAHPATSSSATHSLGDAATDVEATGSDAGKGVVVGLLDGLAEDPETTIFAALIARAQMQEDLDKEGPFTVLAPINSGFERLPAGYLDSLSRKQVETLVRNHLIFEPQTSAELVAAGTFLSALELPHEIVVTDGEIYVDGLTRVTARNQSFQADTVHKVDSVLTVQVFPGTLAEAVHAYPRLSELERHLTEQDKVLLDQDDKTLFAPINGGFAAISVSGEADAGASSAVVGYHVLSHKVTSDELSASGVTKSALGPYLGLSSAAGLAIHDGHRVSHVVIADLQVQSGEDGSVLHVVDTALVAPPSVSEVLAQTVAGETFATLRARFGEATVPGGADSFLTHVAGAEEVTVFAPTDAAFNRIAGAFGNNLTKVVGFHVVDEVVDSSRLLDATEEPPITLTSSAVKTFNVVRVGGPAETTLLLDGLVTITVRDIPAANGVVHAIDGVLVPQGVTFPGTTEQALAAYPALSKVSGAVTQTGLLDDVLSTLFAPYDLAFGEVGSALAFVEAHTVSPGVRDRVSFEGAQVFTTLSGDPIDVDDQTLKLGPVQIVRPDLLTQSGVVHIVDRELEWADADAGADTGD